MIYTVTFNPALDYVIRVNQFALGEVNRTVQEHVFYGGKGINVSTVLARPWALWQALPERKLNGVRQVLGLQGILSM